MVLGVQGMQNVKTTAMDSAVLSANRTLTALLAMSVLTSRKSIICFRLLNNAFKEYPLCTKQMQELL